MSRSLGLGIGGPGSLSHENLTEVSPSIGASGGRLREGRDEDDAGRARIDRGTGLEQRDELEQLESTAC